MSAVPSPILLLDALAEAAALLEPGTHRVLHANPPLLERAPGAVGALPPYPWWPGEPADAVASEVVSLDGDAPLLLAVFRESGVVLDRALRHVATAVAANAEPAEVFELVADAARELLDVDSAGVVRYEGPTHGRVMGQAGIAMPNRRFTLLGENTAAVTARTGRPAHVRDFAELEGDMPRRLVAMGQRSGIAVPVHVDGRLWGALVAGDHRPGQIAERATPSLTEFAGLIGPRPLRPLRPGDRRGAVGGRARPAAGARPRPVGPARPGGRRRRARPVDPAPLRARVRARGEARRRARLGALAPAPPARRRRLHDVGKLAIPDAVLFKPGRLDPGEYEQVKAHSALGAEIVRDLLDEEQVAWVRGHHERPDGRGYPDGLSAERIPDGAAILGVADAYDAMTAARPYSAPLLPVEALEECRRLAGAQFDSDAVRALEAVLGLGGPRRYPSRWGASGS